MKDIKLTKKIIVCGDSFSIGIGCTDLATQPYGSLLSKKLKMPLINLAKGSSTNLSIYLQAKYAVENLATPGDIVMISNTSYDRVEWFPLDHSFKEQNLTNTDVNYHQYPPYGIDSYHDGKKPVQLENPMEHDSDYDGKMFTENYMGVIDYWETFRKDDKESGYYRRFDAEPKERMKTLYDFATTVHEPRINRIYSIGVLAMAHQLLKRANINHLILTHEVAEYASYIDIQNLVNVSWGQLSLDYPDKLKTWHTGPNGHKAAFKTVLAKLKENRWLNGN